ncbi:MAG: hypothetical protein KDD82_13595, partial [Planctomycetes bacterium]|nr:hypothetical protein [Planctomycetota bacterium]
AEAYSALVGDLPALWLLELRRAEREADRETQRSLAREAADTLALPYATLLAASVQVDPRGEPYPVPLDLARLVDEAPEEVPLVRELVRRAAPPRSDALALAISTSRVGAQRRRVATALVHLWSDLQGNLASEQSWSLAAADVLDEALALDPAHPGLRQLHATALLRPAGHAVSDPLVLRAVGWDLELASAALPWALGPGVQALQLSVGQEREAWIDRLGSRGWLWTAERLPLRGGDAPPEWPSGLRRLRPWEASSLTEGFQSAAQLGRTRTALALFLAFFDTVHLGLRASEQNRGVRESLRRLLLGQEDRVERDALEGAVLARHADSIQPEEQRELRLQALRLLARPGAPTAGARRVAGLPSGGALRELRVRPDLPSVWAQGEAVRLGWDASLHRAELWGHLRDDEAAPFSVAALRDPWSRTRALLDGLHDGFDPHQDAALGVLRGVGLDRFAVGLLRAAAFDQRSLPPEDLYHRLVWDVRFNQASTPEALRHAIALTYLFERLDGPTYRGLRSDLLLDLAFRVPEEREALLAEGLRLGREVDPAQVARGCESVATAWWRRARTAALSQDSSGLEAALAQVKGAKDRWGLDSVLAYDPWKARLRERPQLRELVPE